MWSPPSANRGRAPYLSGKALAKWRRARCVELALAGHSYDEIALEVGYQNRGTAWRAVQDSLNSTIAQAVTELPRPSNSPAWMHSRRASSRVR